MCNIDDILRRSSGAGSPASAGAVEVSRDGDRILLRTGPGVPPVGVSQGGWGDFVAAVHAGEFDATLRSGNTFRTSDVAPESTDVVEVTRADDGVLLLRAVPGGNAVHIPDPAWAAFLAGIRGGAFDETLPSADEVLALLDAPR